MILASDNEHTSLQARESETTSSYATSYLLYAQL